MQKPEERLGVRVVCLSKFGCSSLDFICVRCGVLASEQGISQGTSTYGLERSARAQGIFVGPSSRTTRVVVCGEPSAESEEVVCVDNRGEQNWKNKISSAPRTLH